jgi:hypothetical protein
MLVGAVAQTFSDVDAVTSDWSLCYACDMIILEVCHLIAWFSDHRCST